MTPPRDPDLLDRFVEAGLECLERDAAHDVQGPADPQDEPAPGPSSRWGAVLVAAGVLVTGTILWMPSWSGTSTDDARHTTVASAVRQDPRRDKELPAPVMLRGNKDLQALDSAPLAVRWEGVDRAGLERLAAQGRIQHLEVVAPRVDAAQLPALLANITTLRGLYLEVGPESVDLAPLVRLPMLERLSLHGTHIDAERIEPLQDFPALTRLDLRGCEVEREAVAVIGGIPGLRELGITPSILLPISYLAALGEARRRIRSLLLNDRAPLITKKGSALILEDVTGHGPINGLQALSKFRALERLSLRPARDMPGAELRHLGGLTALRDLDLCGCFLVEDEHLAMLPASIERLDLSSTLWSAPLPDRFASLTVLSAQRCPHVTDAAVVALTRLPKLEVLRLRHCPELSEAVVPEIAKLGVEELDLGSASWLGDPQCRQLAAMHGVRRLCVSAQARSVRLSMAGTPVTIGGGERVTVAGIAELLAMPSLVELEIEQLGTVGVFEPPAVVSSELEALVVGETLLLDAGGQPLDANASRTAWQELVPRATVRERSTRVRIPTPPPGWRAAWAATWVDRRS